MGRDVTTCQPVQSFSMELYLQRTNRKLNKEVFSNWYTRLGQLSGPYDKGDVVDNRVFLNEDTGSLSLSNVFMR